MPAGSETSKARLGQDSQGGRREERNANQSDSGQARAGNGERQQGEPQDQSAQGEGHPEIAAGRLRRGRGASSADAATSGTAAASRVISPTEQRQTDSPNEANRAGQNAGGNPQRGANRTQSGQNSGTRRRKPLLVDLDRLLEGRGGYDGGPDHG